MQGPRVHDNLGLLWWRGDPNIPTVLVPFPISLTVLQY